MWIHHQIEYTSLQLPFCSSHRQNPRNSIMNKRFVRCKMAASIRQLGQKAKILFFRWILLVIHSVTLQIPNCTIFNAVACDCLHLHCNVVQVKNWDKRWCINLQYYIYKVLEIRYITIIQTKLCKYIIISTLCNKYYNFDYLNISRSINNNHMAKS